ncbi:MAG TPA: hypothetical protein VIG29_21915 [Vicinamibacteria bacterium]|jgi:hypothetical protein
MKAATILLALFAAFGCTTYEYEEEVFLEVDGSGEIRMSGSAAAIQALHQVEYAGLKGLFAGNGVEIVSTRETERDRRKFVHVEARFEKWEELCGTPAFRGRACRFDEEEEGVALALSLPSPREAAPEELDREAVLALRYHFPSTIRFHNSPGGVERGNILAWKRTLREHFAGRPLDVEVRFDRRTILQATVSVVGFSLALVAAALGTSILLMVRKGRRQLRAGVNGGYPSRSDHRAGE